MKDNSTTLEKRLTNNKYSFQDYHKQSSSSIQSSYRYIMSIGNTIKRFFASRSNSLLSLNRKKDDKCLRKEESKINESNNIIQKYERSKENQKDLESIHFIINIENRKYQYILAIRFIVILISGFIIPIQLVFN